MSTQSIVIVGTGGHAVSVAETAEAAGYVLRSFINSNGRNRMLFGIPVEASIPESYISEGGNVVVAIGENSVREKEWHRIARAVPIEQLPALVHPSASISKYAFLGAGSVVLQGAVVGSGARIGTGCLLNSGSVLEHECEMANFSSLAPGVLTGGRVQIGRRSALSIGVVVKHGLKIGDDTVVGAASYVHVDIPSNVVAYGSPAKIISRRESGDRYLR